MNIVYLDLPTTVKSFVRHTEEADTIVLNARMSAEMQKECYEHEMNHIRNGDFLKCDADQVETAAHGKEGI